jgi:hypothetical protein
MDIVDTRTTGWTGPLDHRDGGVEFCTLFTGEPGRPDNYMLSLVRVRTSYHAPPHRHNFDQVRFILDGKFGFGPQEQEAGQVGYFCEGTVYTQNGDGPSLTLLLQIANASRARYLSMQELDAANRSLLAKGTGRFDHGTYVSEADGKKSRRDGFEAAWEHATGEKIRYSKPRYERPIIMEPEHFAAVPVTGSPGGRRKLLGTFSERELEIGFYEIDSAARLDVTTLGHPQLLLYVTTGTGDVGGQTYGPGVGIRLRETERTTFVAREPTTLFYLGLPKYALD